MARIEIDVDETQEGFVRMMMPAAKTGVAWFTAPVVLVAAFALTEG
jgi:ABC-type transport system involved in cytochrome bd biosynthesis fused ATPase/permease subunit